MIKIERNFTLDCPVEEVFAFLSTVGQSPSYTDGQRAARITSTGPMGVGTTFSISGKFLHHSSTCEVTEYELEHRLAWQTTSGVRATTNWDFERYGARTRVTFLYTQEPTGLGWLRLPEWLQQERANERTDRDLWSLKELLTPSKREAKAWDYQVPPPSASRPQPNQSSNGASPGSRGRPA